MRVHGVGSQDDDARLEAVAAMLECMALEITLTGSPVLEYPGLSVQLHVYYILGKPQ
jgi:hypothetical protein